MLVATGVLAVMVTILFGIFSQGSNAWALGERRTDIYQGSRIVLDMIKREASLAIIKNDLAGMAVVVRNPAQAPAIGRLGQNLVYSELFFVAPIDAGNTLPTTDTAAYRPLCGVHYYVADPATISATSLSSKRRELPSLIREVYTSNVKAPRPTGFSLYDQPWWTGRNPGGTVRTASIIADNVAHFEVSGVRLLPGGRLVPQSGSAIMPDPTQYPALVVGVAVVDRRTASRVNDAGANWQYTMPIQTTTNWATVYFQNFDRP